MKTIRRIDDLMVHWLLQDAPWWQFWYPQSGESGSLLFGVLIVAGFVSLDYVCGQRISCWFLLAFFAIIIAMIVYAITAIFRVSRRRGLI